ncbi:hypothetical protein [Haliscomenobacter hydrossis]|uniref:Outer membrane protein beta-barrel domain-containing protein n=1 Tax=Haliscomenobacter hydrossis (strain ATCC 27775 / DSM 1100 / LMG 10767 / O) TaxID=760192 RepID=F4KUQ5_HALH1|nr:hypothetical protein [Haliscomenobacter hydrossis]AEE53458.1 hypothetical protein Halhy_5635 [Haliscomenobacter hydrossis DSM 1100]
MKYALYLCFVLFLAGSSLYGQDAALEPATGTNNDLVILKTGKRLRGEILKYEVGKEMIFLTDAGIRMKIPAEVLERFVAGARMGEINNSLKPEKPEKPFLAAGNFYNNFAQVMPFGAKTAGNSSTGFGFEYSFGMQMSPKLGLGVGTGMNFMFGSLSDRLIPLVAEIRYYNNPERRHRAYALLDSGYSMGWMADKTSEAYSLKGGWRIHPALGVAWNSRGGSRFSTELGFLHQRATLVEDWWESSRWKRENDYKMNRWVFKMGLLF